MAFDAVKAGVSRKKDIIMIDTAGRLHNKEHLMKELEKIKRSIGKAYENAPHRVVLVLDGTTGQNAIAQGLKFSEVVDVSDLIITKLDGTAKGGAILGVVNALNKPVRFCWVGEAADDLIPFDAEMYGQSL